MPAIETFVDSNVVLYLLSADIEKAEQAECILASNAIVSVQVLNEVANVLRRQSKLSWAETNRFLV